MRVTVTPKLKHLPCVSSICIVVTIAASEAAACFAWLSLGNDNVTSYTFQYMG